MTSGQPKALRSLARVFGLAGVAMSFGTFWLLADRESDLAGAHFELHARERVHAIEERLDDARSALVSMSSFFAASPQVTQSGFHDFAAPISARQPAIRALSWNAVITNAERPAHEARVRAASPGYEIRERSPEGELVPATRRDEHVVPLFIEPHQGNEAALGFDVASEPERLRALSRARDTGELTFTAPIQLVQEPEPLDAALAFLPVYQRGVSVETPAERRAAVEGYVVGVFVLGEVLEAALSGFEPGNIEVLLFDVSAAPEQRLLYAHPQQGPVDGPALAAELSGDDLHLSAALEEAGRDWRIVLRPTATYLAAHRTWAPPSALASGLVITGLLVFVAGRNRRLHAEVIERERAERIAVEREERLHLTLDAIADGAWDWNLVTGEVYFSDSWLASLGYQRWETEPTVDFWKSIVHPDDWRKVEEVLADHFEGRTQVYECENRLRRKSGEYRPNLDRGKVVLRDEKGRPLRMVGTDTDITRQKESEREKRLLQERVQRAQKLESLSVLAGGVAHDFNNLLAAILGGAELALKRIPAGSPAHEEVERIRLVATRAAELTEQMLSFSGKGRFVVERVDLSRLIEETAQLLETAISKKARLELELRPELPAVEGDPAQLRQVALNLITNASEALGEESGRITLRTDLVVVAPGVGNVRDTELAPGSYVALEVSDTGAGMAPEVRARVFDPFFSTKFQGRGLGLAAVQGIVRSHGGAISVDSTAERGTTFRVLLPARGVPASPPVRDPLPATDANGSGTVLVADDEPEVLRVISTSLEEAGFRVLTAADGRAALDCFLEHKDGIVAVLLDATMPCMSGREALAKIRAVRPEVPVILASGYSEESLVDDEQADGAPLVFLQKPYRMSQLVAKLSELLRGPSEASERRHRAGPDKEAPREHA